MREIEFKGYFGDEELFVKVALNKKRKKSLKRYFKSCRCVP